MGSRIIKTHLLTTRVHLGGHETESVLVLEKRAKFECFSETKSGLKPISKMGKIWPLWTRVWVLHKSPSPFLRSSPQQNKPITSSPYHIGSGIRMMIFNTSFKWSFQPWIGVPLNQACPKLTFPSASFSLIWSYFRISTTTLYKNILLRIQKYENVFVLHNFPECDWIRQIVLWLFQVRQSCRILSY